MTSRIPNLYCTKYWQIHTEGYNIPELILWKDSLSELFESLNNIDPIDMDKNPNRIIYLTTPDKIHDNTDQINIDVQVCLLGGIGNINYDKQISRAKDLDIDFFISDVVHQEIKSLISESNYTFIENKYNLINLKSDFISESRIQKEGYVKLISYNKPRVSTSEKILCALSSVENVEHVRLESLPPEEWLHHSLPGNNTKSVIVDHPFPALNAILAKACAQKSLCFKYLNKKGLLAPSRIEHLYYEDAYVGIDSIAGGNSQSMREHISEIIKSFDYSPKKSSLNFASQSYLSETIAKLDWLQLSKRRNNRNNYAKEKFLFSNNPINYISRQLDNDLGLARTNELISSKEFNAERLPQHFIIKIYKANLRSLFKLQGMYAWLYAKKLVSISTVKHLLALSEMSKETNSKQLVSDLGNLLQNSFQYHNTDKDQLQLVLKSLYNLNLTIITKANISLGLLDFNLFEELYQINLKQNKERGFVGMSVLMFLYQNNITNKIIKQNIDFLRKLLNNEISDKNETIHTFNSLAFIDIIESEGKAVLDYIINPRIKRNDYLYSPYFYNNLAFLLCFYQQKELADKLIDRQISSPTPFSTERELGILVLLILLGKTKEATKQAILLTGKLNDKLDLWSHEIQPSHLTFYLSVIFKFNKMNDELIQSEELMKFCECAWTTIHKNLLDRFTPNKSPSPEIQSLCSLLSHRIPSIAL